MSFLDILVTTANLEMTLLVTQFLMHQLVMASISIGPYSTNTDGKFYSNMHVPDMRFEQTSFHIVYGFFLFISRLHCMWQLKEVIWT